MRYICNNKEAGVKKEPCLYTWDSSKWNKDIDTEYTRNEKCSKCGSKDISNNNG